MFDYLVIGKGLFGTGAIRHLSNASSNIAILGPDEPADAATHDGIFASHYDQGRISSATGPDPIWNALDRIAMAEFRPLEEASGIPFYSPVGLMRIYQGRAPIENPDNRRTYYRFEDEPSVKLWTNNDVRDKYNLQFPDGFEIFVEEHGQSGYINPRELIRAQLKVAEAAGATVIRETAVSIQQHPTHLTITTKEGQIIEAKKVLLATGAYTNSFDLLQRKLALRLKGEIVILGRVPQSEVERLQNMPAITYEIDSPELDGIYLLPPIKYPDGHYYLKMGCDTSADYFLNNHEEVTHWMKAGNSDLMKEKMAEAIEQIIPGVQVTDWHTRRCLVTYTPQHKPFIDAIIPGQLYVATAGNGSGAHPADGIGRLAADLMVHEEWRSDLDHSTFQIAYADEATW